MVNSDAEFTEVFTKYCDLMRGLRELRGMSAAVYTQWTDVEGEINGHYTYDRKVFKGDFNTIRNALVSTYNGAGPDINPPAGYVAWESHNYPMHFIRHMNARGQIDHSVNPEGDMYWKMVPDLAGTGVSFESYNFPGTYLRHQNGEIWRHASDGSQLFIEDATFYMRTELADPSKVSFESYNFLGRYIRHRSYKLFSEAVTDKTGRNDATFMQFEGQTAFSQRIEAENYADIQMETLMLYPNPVVDLLHIQEGIKGKCVVIFTPAGKKVYEGPFQRNIDVSAFTAGMFILQIESANRTVKNGKFFKK